MQSVSRLLACLSHLGGILVLKPEDGIEYDNWCVRICFVQSSCRAHEIDKDIDKIYSMQCTVLEKLNSIIVFDLLVNNYFSTS